MIIIPTISDSVCGDIRALLSWHNFRFFFQFFLSTLLSLGTTKDRAFYRLWNSTVFCEYIPPSLELPPAVTTLSLGFRRDEISVSLPWARIVCFWDLRRAKTNQTFAEYRFGTCMGEMGLGRGKGVILGTFVLCLMCGWVSSAP